MAPPSPLTCFWMKPSKGGCARITEVSESGSVPALRFVNDCDCPVLLLDGEELVGAKQNRVINSAFWPRPGSGR